MRTMTIRLVLPAIAEPSFLIVVATTTGIQAGTSAASSDCGERAGRHRERKAQADETDH
jgi:hypothetical protein